MGGIVLTIILIIIGIVAVTCNVDESKTQSFIGYGVIIMGILCFILLILEAIGVITPNSICIRL